MRRSLSGFAEGAARLTKSDRYFSAVIALRAFRGSHFVIHVSGWFDDRENHLHSALRARPRVNR
jgi:hypothetical protein